MQSSAKSILVVLTNSSIVSPSCSSASKCCSTPTGEHKYSSGFDIREVAYIYLCLSKKMNYHITFSTPSGGISPVDPVSRKEAEKDSNIREFLHDSYIHDSFQDTKPLSSINADEYFMVLVPGKHAAMMDLTANETLRSIIDTVYFKNNGILGTIGHGAAALLCSQPGTQDSSPSGHNSTRFCSDFLKNRKCTGPTDEEEKSLNVEQYLPYSIEGRLRECNADFVCSPPFTCNVVVDDRLVTGQNSHSISKWIETLIGLVECSKS